MRVNPFGITVSIPSFPEKLLVDNAASHRLVVTHYRIVMGYFNAQVEGQTNTSEKAT